LSRAWLLRVAVAILERAEDEGRTLTCKESRVLAKVIVKRDAK
jgi:hypothetical protein